MASSMNIIDKTIDALRAGSLNGEITPPIKLFALYPPTARWQHPSALVEITNESFRQVYLDTARLNITLSVESGRPDDPSPAVADSKVRLLHELVESVRKYLNRIDGPISCLRGMELNDITYRNGDQFGATVAQATMSYTLRFKGDRR